MSDTALLIIDAQESFRQRASWHEVDSPGYLDRQQALKNLAALEQQWGGTLAERTARRAGAIEAAAAAARSTA